MRLSQIGNFANCEGSLPVDLGLSEDAEFVRRQMARVFQFPSGTSSREERHHEILARLADAQEESRSEDWLAEGRNPVTSDTLASALRFARLIPPTVPVPDIRPDQDGDVSFDWSTSARNVLSVSVSSTGLLHYAALFGFNRVHGVENFAGFLPIAIRTNLRRLYTETIE